MCLLSIYSIHHFVCFCITIVGILCALLVGLSGGSILVPLHYVPKSQAGLVFIPSFGLGCIVFSPMVCAVAYLYTGIMPDFQFKKTFLTGLLSGFVWNLSNVLSVVAIPNIGYAVAYPIMQCALLISGMWGIFLFKVQPSPE